MTKAQELKVLDSAIAALGNDSYLGPWLAQVRHEAEQLIWSDLPVQISVVDAAKNAEEVVAAAKGKAQQLVQDAEARAQRREAEAGEEAHRIRREARRALEAALSRV